MSIHKAVFQLPWYDTHCHIGCLRAVGFYDGAFACDCVKGKKIAPLDLGALLTTPYIEFAAYGVGVNLDHVAKQFGYAASLEWARANLQEWWRANVPILKRLEIQGVMRSLVRGMHDLHGIDLIFDENIPIRKLNEDIKARYESDGFYGVWGHAFARMNCIRAIKLVEMPYYDLPAENEDDWEAEKELVTTALRVDSLAAFGIPDEYLAFRLNPRKIGINADCLSDYLDQIIITLNRAVSSGAKAIKNAYAYFNTLAMPEPDMEVAERFFREQRPEDRRAFEAVVFNQILTWANDHRMPYQIHAGIIQIPWCDPDGLIEQIRTYRNVKFSLLHIHPYTEKAGCLALHHPNVYLDPCWLAILNPDLLRSSLRQWIGFVAPEKILYGIDSSNPEEWLGASLFAKEALADVLEEKIESGVLTEEQAIATARAILHDNAARWYA